ncbi:hypothetical protein ABFA07_022653 [Porites harrisoni]
MPEPVSFLLRNLSPNLQPISAWHASMIIDSKSKSVQTLPVWLQDVLVNGLSFWQSDLCLRDGRWRQFECLDCFDIDSVHNDFQRGILYVLFYPDLVENVMCAWAKYQGDNGHVVETLAAGCYSPTRKIDCGPPNQRIMRDVTTVFITESYHFYLWTNISVLLRHVAARG